MRFRFWLITGLALAGVGRLRASTAARPALAARAPVEARDAVRRRSAGGSVPPALVRRARRRLTSATASPAEAAAAIEASSGRSARRSQLPAHPDLCLVVLGAGMARADDYVIVRGAYYREASTRVIQPMVELQRDSPSGIDVGAHFLVDAITSASIAAGHHRRQRLHRDSRRGRLPRAQALGAQRPERRVQVQRRIGLLVARHRRVVRHAPLGRHGGAPGLVRAQLRHDVGEGPDAGLPPGHGRRRSAR